MTTADGYVLRIERIPRPGSPRVAFFLHGILDTSLTWVSAGVTGSQAFGAWDAGQDVWLGSSRSNPPRTATGAHGAVWYIVLGRLESHVWAAFEHLGLNDVVGFWVA